MKITLSDQAISWFENEFPLHKGEAVRFFGKTYGTTEVHDGFSVGVKLDNPETTEDVMASTELNQRIYFISSEDEWFFHGYDLLIEIDEIFKEPSYHFQSNE